MEIPVSRPAAIAAFCAAIVVSALSLKDGVETDLVSLVSSGRSGDAGAETLSSLTGALSSGISVICETPEAEAKCRTAFDFAPRFDFDSFKTLIVEKGDGLLSSSSRELLLAGDTGRIRRSARRRDYSTVGLFPKQDDPWYFLHDFVMEMSSFMPKDLPEGVVQLYGEYSPSDPMRGDDALARLIAIAESDEKVSLSGAPFHSYLAKAATKREINILSCASLAVAALLGWFLFRSFRFVLPMAFLLSFGFAVATAVAGLLPGRLHALTFLFGTTLIGLGVDYVYHTLGGCLRRDLGKAFLTTAATFSPLFFSSVRILPEMALFTISGLAAVFWASALLVPKEKGAKT